MNNSPKYDERPWGNFTVLDEQESFKVKRIEVLPGKRLSYQMHAQRAEHWYIVAGIAKVTLDGKDLNLQAGEAVDIPQGTAHRIENPGTEKMIFLSRCSAALILVKMTSCVCRMITGGIDLFRRNR